MFVVEKSSQERVVGGTEQSWCRAVSAGTGITVLALQLKSNTAAADPSVLRPLLNTILDAHPVLRSKLHYSATKKAFSFTTPPTSQIQIQPLDKSSTLHLLPSLSDPDSPLPPLQLILEHELSNNLPWANPALFPPSGVDLVFATVYALPDARHVVALRFHTAVCDRTTAESLLSELVGAAEGGIQNQGEGSFGIEDVMPVAKSKKKLWAHGLDVLGYSFNSFRLTNIKFKDVKAPRTSRVLRLRISRSHTSRILEGCNSAGIKLCGVLTAAGLIAAAHSSDDNHKNKYGVVTLTDCRSILNSPLSSHHFGFYHSAVLNVHKVNGGEKLWDLAKTSYTEFANSKKCNKHFSDMADLNFLMCKALENPSLTSSSALRSSMITVFEEPVVVHDTLLHRQSMGMEDFVGCSSVHGVGPSIAFFDTIIEGQLDCVCVYPSPLHSREQMQEILDHIKRLLIEAAYSSLSTIS
ncbi:unnamed protein product [Cuscuta europaea]|uniref:Condensation domain-containing protein n=1 Tax=Cuscuta europaea TaxID=41803 RepID=A0A9P1EMC2_CUSEU|nr:unnamed protein product [Cuscuta europaea]